MDRRTIWAILLMMVIAIAPAIFFKKPSVSGEAGKRVSGADSAAPATPAAPRDSGASDSVAVLSRAPVAMSRDSGKSAPYPLTRLPAPPPGAEGATEDTVRVTSPLYTYGISSRGGRLVE